MVWVHAVFSRHHQLTHTFAWWIMTPGIHVCLLDKNQLTYTYVWWTITPFFLAYMFVWWSMPADVHMCLVDTYICVYWTIPASSQCYTYIYVFGRQLHLADIYVWRTIPAGIHMCLVDNNRWHIHVHVRGTVKKFVDSLYSLQTIWRNSVKFTHMALWCFRNDFIQKCW